MNKLHVKAILIFIGLMVYSAVLAQGGQSTYMPITMKAAEPTITLHASVSPSITSLSTLIPSSTATPTITRTPRISATPTSSNSPTPTPIYFVNHNFEQGSGVGWEEYSLNNLPIVIHNSKGNPPLPTHSGEWLAWMGGADNESATLSNAAVITYADFIYLTYWYRIDSDEPSCVSSDDEVRIAINGDLVFTHALCSESNTDGYEYAEIEISDYAYTDTMVRFTLNTDGAILSNFFIDDVNITLH